MPHRGINECDYFIHKNDNYWFNVSSLKECTNMYLSGQNFAHGPHTTMGKITICLVFCRPATSFVNIILCTNIYQLINYILHRVTYYFSIEPQTQCHLLGIYYIYYIYSELKQYPMWLRKIIAIYNNIKNTY